jgi:hypothetical protein
LLTLVVFLLNVIAWSSEAEALTRSVGDLPSEAQQEPKQAQGHVRDRLGCPSPNRKRRSACLAESGKMAARTNQRSNDATGSGSSVVEDGGSGEDDSKPSPVTSRAPTGSNRGQEAVQEEARPESGQMASRTNHGGDKAAFTCGPVEDDVRGRGEEEFNPSLVTSGAQTDSHADQEVDQEEATTPDEIPSGWTRAKLEPDC